jgi:excinuclease UvrABC ATPase subunit
MPEERQIIWKEFHEKYNQYFKIDNKDLWKNNLQDLKKFIYTNNKRSTNIKYIKKDKFKNDKEKQEYEEIETNIKKIII